MGPGNGAVGAPDVLLERLKMLLKVCWVKDPRRGRAEPSEEGLSVVDILKIKWFDGSMLRCFDASNASFWDGAKVIVELLLALLSFGECFVWQLL